MTCFLCLHNFSVQENEEDEEKGKIFNCKNVSLAAINYYLKLSENSKSSSISTINSKEQEVIMCQECENVVSRLSILCNQLEEIKLKINYSLEQFYEKLEKADEYGKLEDNDLGEELLILRSNYRKTCKSKLDHLPKPVIKIDKLKIVKVRMKNELVLSEAENEDDEFEMNDCTNSEENDFQDNTLQLKHEDDANENNREDSSSSMSSNAVKSFGSIKKGSYRDDFKGKYSCKDCGLKFPTKWERRQHTHVHRNARKMEEANFICTKCNNHQMFREAAGLRRHNMIFHLDMWFPEYRLDGISLSQFGEYCKHVFHVEGLISKVPNSLGYQCQNCKDEKVQFNTYVGLKKHLFGKHMEVLGRKIEELQRTTGVEELKQAVLPPVRGNSRCKACGATFSQFGSLCRHLRQSCPFRKNKSVSGAKPCECRECGARYTHVAGFYNHRKKRHPNSTQGPLFI